ncbi:MULTISPECIES: hypothetical protein [Thermomonospora]|uniref:Uncharacterized protein n=1 Tax=Thermomonospora curvata (strain ATCC 19995 / DSM 43183 / JCM 3096 / KCTC 9072 / NBRC 15933 / NCIMB 10081 / Henssen B9) TaxID=471852 RepID=D1ADW1_THECD|nr:MULTISPECIES: hypothetical protein [Thermomonospora]ACY97571.1 hypothetical protein Tcur_2004 [Thermomonospora curvata DSM 43183]PKK14518.1 MAG: hypothetical protein BUE48_009775 [Thermomonospora sp. CIF 1]
MITLGRQTFQRPSLFSWTVVVDHDDRRRVGACGVCDDRLRAMRHLGEALLEAPIDAVGLVHRVTVGVAKLGYLYHGLIARGRLNPATGTVDWLEAGCPPWAWGRMDALVKAVTGKPGEIPPPEAVALGLADPDPGRFLLDGR